MHELISSGRHHYCSTGIHSYTQAIIFLFLQHQLASYL
jgi:hypothetical protein